MKEISVSGEGGDGRVNRVQGFPVTIHQSLVKLLTALHKILVPQLHVTFRDGLFWIFIIIFSLLLAFSSSHHVRGHGWHPHGRRWHHVTWWRVSIRAVVIVVATVVAVVSAVVSAVVATITTAVVSTVLVIAAPLRVVTPLTSCRMAAVVSGLCWVVATVTLTLASLVRRLLAFRYSNTEPQRFPPQRRSLALLNRLLLLALVTKLDEAVASEKSDHNYASCAHQLMPHTCHVIATYEKQNIMGIIMVELKLAVLLLT